MTIRFGWKSIEKPGEIEYLLDDTVITITDSDGTEYTKTFESSDILLSPFNDVINFEASKDVAADYIKKNSFIETDEGLFIPRHNIKHISFKQINERVVCPPEYIRDIKEWHWPVLLIFAMICALALGPAGILIAAKLGLFQ